MTHQLWLDAINKKLTTKKPSNQQSTASPSASPPQKPQKIGPVEPVPLKPIPGLAQAATMGVDEVLEQKKTHSAPSAPAQSAPAPVKAKKSVRVQSPER